MVEFDHAHKLSPEDYLMHYGVKGMKWGVRRYQNKDGSLTNAGKQRYGSKSVSLNEIGGNEDGYELIYSGKDFCLSKSDRLYRVTDQKDVEKGSIYVSATLEDLNADISTMNPVGPMKKDYYAKTYELKKDLKVAGMDEQFKILAKLQNDPDYASSYEESVEIDLASPHTPIRSAMVKELKKSGYDAVVDMNDARFDFSSTPLVILDSEASIGKEYVQKVWDKDKGRVY